MKLRTVLIYINENSDKNNVYVCIILKYSFFLVVATKIVLDKSLP